MSVATHPNQTYLIVIGMYDGNVAVFNTHLTEKTPQFQSNSVNNKHWGIVWQVRTDQPLEIPICGLQFSTSLQNDNFSGKMGCGHARWRN